MSSNRVGPISPDPNRSQAVTPKTQREQTQRVEKVREVDPDEQARKRQFQKCMEDADDDVTPRTPSPFETQFYTDDAPTKQVPDATDGAVPSPSYSPPPSLSGAAPSDETADELPTADEFWQGVGLPDQPQKPGTPQPKTASGKESSPLGVPGKPVTPAKSAKPAAGRPATTEPTAGKGEAKTSKVPDEKLTPTARYWEPEAESKPQPTLRGASPEKPAAKDKKPVEPQLDEPRAGVPSTPTRSFDKRGKDRDQEQQTVIQPPSVTPLPDAVQPQAVAATTAASPYLSPEVLPLFYQMVGSVMIMTYQPQGVSRTEVVLNSPSFARSKFFGARIEIVRYATAPDSFNIRLSGSNEAVAAFQQNIPSLMNAFKQGNFQFRIGRLEAELERPVFKRKDERRGGGTSGGGDLSGGKR